MNFPANQQTGVLAEVDVERLFLSWGWNVGHDRIDIGYDLCVTPARTTYQGARFLVQVKGTAQRKKKGNIVAPVSKDRLREYAEDVLPVFIVRATPDGCLYWLHAQAWARANQDRLRGLGTSGVRFELSRRLDDRVSFESYLAQILSRTSSADSLSDLAEESRILNSLDPRLGVRINVRGKTKEHHVFATSETVDSKFTFSPLKSPENLSNLHDAIDFGLPRSIEVESFNMTGSPLFEHLGASGPKSGTLTMRETSSHSGMVRLFPGNKHSVSATEFALEAEMFSGLKGAAITNEMKESPIDLNVRILAHQGPGNLNANLGVRPLSISGRPIQHVDSLRPLAAWAEQVVMQRSMFMELGFKGIRVRAGVSGDGLDSLRPFLHLARTLSRLHLVARTLDSALTLPLDFEISAGDVGDIDLAYALLKGGRTPVNLGPIVFEPTHSLDGITGDNFFCTTTLSLSILDQPLGDIPVAIEFSDYLLEPVTDSNMMRLSVGEAGQAWISYSDHGDSDMCLRSAKDKQELLS